MKIYISIPITGRPLCKAKSHAERLRREMSGYGHDAITPFDICQEQGKSYPYYISRDIEALMNCQAIVLGVGWEESKGCRLEESCAQIYGLNILQEEYLDLVDLTRMVYKI